ncbi:hypothetical protein CHCC20375_3458 [Bacillus licheniformis]|nr:hypothetical protein CHCC20375_3458 [Bacillus licheniformis]
METDIEKHEKEQKQINEKGADKWLQRLFTAEMTAFTLFCLMDRFMIR